MEKLLRRDILSGKKKTASALSNLQKNTISGIKGFEIEDNNNSSSYFKDKDIICLNNQINAVSSTSTLTSEDLIIIKEALNNHFLFKDLSSNLM
jgi:hypothetical protein